MSKKLPPMKRMTPAKRKVTLTGKTKSKGAAAVATKAKTNTPAQADDAPMPQAVTKPKPHARTGKKSEADRIAKGKQLAASYLMQRDGMDADTANMVVGSMDADTINELNTEAATAVLDKTASAAQQPAPSAAAASPADTGTTSTAEAAGEVAPDPVDFFSVPALMEYEAIEQYEDGEVRLTLPEIADRCRDAAVTKNQSEKLYKAYKELIKGALRNAGIALRTPVTCLDIKMTPYKGKGPRTLSDIKLLEAGVSPDTIAKCWVQNEYEDVRITTIEGDE